MESTDLYDTMTHLANEIKVLRGTESGLQREINSFELLSKQTEARLMGEICAEKETVEVPPKTKDGEVTYKEVQKFGNQQQREAELAVRLSCNPVYSEWAGNIKNKSEERQKLMHEIEQKDMLFRAALSQNMREAKSVTILSQKTVVVREEA